MAQSTVGESQKSDGATCVVQIGGYYVESCCDCRARGRCRGRGITTGYVELSWRRLPSKTKAKTDSHGESQKSSVQALALPQPKKVMWNVGIRMADVTAEVKLELEVLQSERQCCLPVCCAQLPGRAEAPMKITSLPSRRHKPCTPSTVCSCYEGDYLAMSCFPSRCCQS